MLDRAGERIGPIEKIYLVEETGRPEWALVKLGRLKSRTTLVPLTSAQAVKDGIKVGYEKPSSARRLRSIPTTSRPRRRSTRSTGTTASR